MGYGINFWAMRAWDDGGAGAARETLRNERRRAFDEDEFLRCSAVCCGKFCGPICSERVFLRIFAP